MSGLFRSCLIISRYSMLGLVNSV